MLILIALLDIQDDIFREEIVILTWIEEAKTGL